MRSDTAVVLMGRLRLQAREIGLPCNVLHCSALSGGVVQEVTAMREKGGTPLCQGAFEGIEGRRLKMCHANLQGSLNHMLAMIYESCMC